MYFVGFDTDENAQDIIEFDKTYVAHEAGYMAYTLWNKLSAGGFHGYVFIEDEDTILATIDTGTPSFNMPDGFE